MKARPAVVYSVLRILAFVVPFGIMMLFPAFQELYWLAAIFAALIGLSLSILFLRRPLAEATAGIGEPHTRRRVAGQVDADAEDTVADDAFGTPLPRADSDDLSSDDSDDDRDSGTPSSRVGD